MEHFEQAFQTFMSLGGFMQPCLDEMAQRVFVQRKAYAPRKCRHGLRVGTCTVCNGESRTCLHGIPQYSCETCSRNWPKTPW
jgi:hypothetical protein